MIACPTCGDPLSVHGVCGSCGYGRKGKAPARVIDVYRNRCAWISSGEQCRYVGTISHTIPTPEHYPDLFCRGHFGCNDAAHGQRIVDESRYAVPANFDYSTEAIVARSRALYRAKPVAAPLTPEQGAEIERKWPQLARLRPNDDEREAIQNEGQWDTH